MNTITKTHSIFGQGTLVSENATTITVRFSVGEKTFLKAKVKFLEDGSAKENKVSNGSKKRAKDAIELAKIIKEESKESKNKGNKLPSLLEEL